MTQSLRLGIAGLGTVGAGLVRLLDTHRDRLNETTGRMISITGVSARDKKRDRGVDVSKLVWHDDPVKLAQSPQIDVFVELVGGEGGAAKASVEAALAAKKHVVTANKALLAHHGMALAAEAEKQGVSLNFEAAVAGGIPVIKTLRESLAGNAVTRIYGILNGTSNFILTMMQEEGQAYGDALAVLERSARRLRVFLGDGKLARARHRQAQSRVQNPRRRRLRQERNRGRGRYLALRQHQRLVTAEQDHGHSRHLRRDLLGRFDP